MQIEDAIDTAVQYCISYNVLKDILIAHRAEVVSVCLTEFNEKVFVASIREEGIALGERSMLVKLVKEGYIPMEKTVEELQMSEEEFFKLLASEETDSGAQLEVFFEERGIQVQSYKALLFYSSAFFV